MVIHWIKILALYAAVLAGTAVVEASSEQDFELQLKQTNYISESIDKSHFTNYSDFLVRYFSENFSSDYQSKVDVSALISLSDGETSYYVVPDLFIARKLGGNPQKISMTLGRMKHGWSQFDDYWGLGIWQPQFRADYINPESQGLTGIFVSFENTTWNAGFFASTLFLPDQGPSFNEEDGDLVSNNRWFQQPSSSARVNQGETDINYEVKFPANSEIINQRSLALWAGVGDKKEGYWSQLSLTYKPMNQIHLASDPEKIFVLGSESTQARALIYPFVVHHSVATLEAGFSSDDIKTWMSMSYEKPSITDVPKGWDEAPLYANTFLGLLLNHRLDFIGVKRTQLIWSYLRKEQGSQRNRNQSDSTSLQSSLERFPFRDVVSVEARMNLLANTRMTGHLKYLYALDETGGLLQAKVSYQPDRHWMYSLGMDVLGVEDTKRGGDGFFARYQGNDRVYGGLSYVF